MTSLIPASVRPLVTKGDAPDKWMVALSLVLTDALFSNTWSFDGGPACRAVFAFQNGLRLSWLGDGNEGTPSTLYAWVDPSVASWYPEGHFDDAPVPLLDDYDIWDHDAQAWVFRDLTPERAAIIITSAVERFGWLHVALPWGAFTSEELVETITTALTPGVPFVQAVESLSTEETDRIVAEATDLSGAEEDDVDAIAGTVALAAAALGGVFPPTSWGQGAAEVVMGDSLMPTSSANARFQQFMSFMEEKPDWVVIWDECCGTCFGSTYTMMREDKNLQEGAPSLALFGQNAQYKFPPDGTIDYEFYQNNAEEVEVIRLEAERAGLKVTIDGTSITVS